jgi:outer membrane protein assembly factor BamB
VPPELACSRQLSTPGYYSSLNAAEVADAQRSQLYPCAIFSGARTGPNTVTARTSVTAYQGATFLNNREPGELYLVGGDNPPPTGTVPPGPFVAKVDATTGRQIWRTVLDDANVSHHWIAVANLNILADGTLAFAWNHFVVLLDLATGKILRQQELPTGPAGPADGHYKHLTVAPDGTIILKQQNRPFGCTTQGGPALITCPGSGGGPAKQANSTMVAVDPHTLRVYDQIQVPEMTATPHTITMFHGRIAIYTAGSTNGLQKLYRYFWNPTTKKLSQPPAPASKFWRSDHRSDDPCPAVPLVGHSTRVGCGQGIHGHHVG